MKGYTQSPKDYIVNIEDQGVNKIKKEINVNIKIQRQRAREKRCAMELRQEQEESKGQKRQSRNGD